MVQKDSNYSDVSLKFFKKDDEDDVQVGPSLSMAEPDFDQFIRLKIQRVIATTNVGGEQILSPTQILTLSKDMDEPLKLARRIIDLVDCPNRKICVTMRRYNLDQQER